MCEIRFLLTKKDGKLEEMIKCIDSNIRTEVVKEALRYFLKQVINEKVESNFINSSDLIKFKSNVKENLFSVDDLLLLISNKNTSMQSFQNEQIQDKQNITQNIAIDESINEVKDEDINEDINEDEEQQFIFDDTNVSVNENLIDIDF